MAFRAASVLLILASLVLVWSESVFQLELKPPLSIPALILQDENLGWAALELTSFLFILYMCACTYSTLFKVRVFDYLILSQHHTDPGSLLFTGSYLCRLTFPLCYNFLNMLQDDENSTFSEYIGKAVNFAPLLGDGYNKWLPVMVLVIACITLFNLHGRVLRLFGVKGITAQPDPRDPEILEGRRVIEQERALDERRGERQSSPSATTARSFLSKYKKDDASQSLLVDGSRPRTSSESSTGSMLSMKSASGFTSRLWGESPPRPTTDVPTSSRVFGNEAAASAPPGGGFNSKLWASNPGAVTTSNGTSAFASGTAKPKGKNMFDDV